MEKYSWISYKIDLRKFPYEVWILLGQCISKCEQIKYVPLLPEVKDELHLVYLVKGVQATTAIEGNTLSEEEVRQILEGQLQLDDSKKYLQKEVENIIQACNDIAKGLDKGQHKIITKELLCELNEYVLKDVPCEEGVIPGQVRKYRVKVGPYLAPDARELPELLEKFCNWINTLDTANKKLDPVALSIVKAIAAHLYIAWIHPFGDGNGRTARLVEFALLLASGVPSPAAHLLSNHYNATGAEYYRQLDRTSKSGGDVREFFAYAIQGFHDGLQNVIAFISRQIQDISWEHYIYESFRKLPRSPVLKRQRDVVLQLSRKVGPIDRDQLEKLTAKVYLDAKKTKNTFTRDLNALLKMKLIVQREGKYEPNVGLILKRLPFNIS